MAITRAVYSASAALDIDLGGLATSASGVGVQSDVVDNSTDRFQSLLVYVKIRTGTTPLADTAVWVYGIRDDRDAGAPHRSDGAAALKGSLTRRNAPLLGAIQITAGSSSFDYFNEFVFRDPGPGWGLLIVNKSGVSLDATGSNHHARFVGVNQETL